MKISIFALALLVSSLSVAGNEFEEFTINFACNEGWACTQVTGPFSRAVAEVNHKVYTVTKNEATCCQLAQRISSKVCNDGQEVQGTLVTCE